MILAINAIWALHAFAWAALVGAAYIPHIPLRNAKTPATYLAWSFVVASTFYMPRVLYWDVWFWLQGGELANPWLNIVVNSGVIISAICAMKARLHAIPDDERGGYNIITAVRYPNAAKLFR